MFDTEYDPLGNFSSSLYVGAYNLNLLFFFYDFFIFSHVDTKLNFQRLTVSWKLFSGRFVNAVMTVHASSIAEYGFVAIGNNFTLGAGITQYASTN